MCFTHLSRRLRPLCAATIIRCSASPTPMVIEGGTNERLRCECINGSGDASAWHETSTAVSISVVPLQSTIFFILDLWASHRIGIIILGNSKGRGLPVRLPLVPKPGGG